MRKLNFLLLFGLSITPFLTGCGEDEPAPGVTWVAISPAENFELYVDETKQLTAVVAPETATDKTVVWTSSSPNVATVENGLVTAVSTGSARITATAGGKSASVNVTVVTNPLTDGWVSNMDMWGYPAVAFEENVPENLPYLHLLFNNRQQCSGAILMVNYSRTSAVGVIATRFNSYFPESAAVTNYRLNVDLFSVPGCGELFDGKTIEEIQQTVQGQMSEILDNWNDVLNLVTSIGTNEDWKLSKFDCFGTMGNQQHIDYVLLNMGTMGMTPEETGYAQLVPEATQLVLTFNNVTGECESAYTYIEFVSIAACQVFSEDYIKDNVTFTDDVVGGQGESLQITLHTIPNNIFTGKTREQIVEISESEIIRNVLNLCIK